jgi:DNA uptake protein ComE-like DNA-binding protein
LNGVVNELSELREEAIGITVKRVLDKIDPKLDLNLADEKDLMTVPAIGPKLASEIVKLRETKGKFSSIEELAEVKKISKNVIKNNRWDKFLKV